MRLICNPVRLTISLLLALTFQSVSVLADETWPTKQTLKIVVPYAPGGGADILARLLAEQISRTQGSTMVIENRPGAGAAIGAEAVSRAAPDG